MEGRPGAGTDGELLTGTWTRSPANPPGRIQSRSGPGRGRELHTVGDDISIGGKTSKNIEFDYEHGRTTPIMRVKLPARPKDKAAKVKKHTFIFHLTIKNLW